MKILIFGVPGSGKSSFVGALVSRNMAAVRFVDGDEINDADKIFQEACRLEEKNIPVLVDFTCPYDKDRKNYDVTIWMDTIEKPATEFEIPTSYTERISGWHYSHRDQLNIIQKKYLPHIEKYSDIEFKIDIGYLYLAGIELR
jgi:GTPase SAR1 family protein